MDHASTGHANSPVTIVVGRAHNQKVAPPTGAAPRMVINTALFKKDMKMDEDLTGNSPLSIPIKCQFYSSQMYVVPANFILFLSGISEMFKTPANERKRRSVISESDAMKTPVGGLGASVVEPSVLNTPEEPGNF